MRRTLVGLISLLLLTACGTSDAGPIGDADLAKHQDAADAVARTVVSALVTDLGAKPPGDGSLGRGLYAGCDGGDPDEASYFIDTFVTYDVRTPAEAATQVQKSLAGAGLEAKAPTATHTVEASKGDVTIDTSSQEKGGGSAGQNIFVSTGCLAIGKKAISDFNAKNGRPVAP